MIVIAWIFIALGIVFAVGGLLNVIDGAVIGGLISIGVGAACVAIGNRLRGRDGPAI